jgi:hypothetical protein
MSETRARPVLRYKPKPINPTRKGTPKSWQADPNVDAWLDECCTLDPNASTFASSLRRSWLDWCCLEGIHPGHRLHLGQQLTLHGLPAFKAGARHMGMRAGIRVLPPERAL